MKHVVSFSGGRTSAYLVYLMEQKRIKEGWDVDYVFCDTGAEHEGTYKFIRQVEKNFGINITCLRAVVSQEKGVGVTYEFVPVNRVAVAAISNPDAAHEFNEMLVNNDKNEELKGAIYRGKMTLDGIAKLYDGYDKEQIISTMRIRKGCSVSDGESCEVFGCQGDLFDDA